MEFTSEDLPAALDVSRETLGRLKAYMEMVGRWNPRINLVSRATMPDAWRRHIVDSAQLWLHADPAATTWLDIGSGGGFPGLVVAIMAPDLSPRLRVTLIDADQRKCVFLREAARQLEIAVTVLNQRVETLTPAGADVISARALAPLCDLLGHANRHLGKHGTALFLKGKMAQSEIDEAREKWSFEFDRLQSLTSSDGVILKVWGVAHA